MTAVTVRTMLQMILENNMQMDDVIQFDISEETNECAQELNFIDTTTFTIEGDSTKYLSLIFDLDVIY